MRYPVIYTNSRLVGSSTSHVGAARFCFIFIRPSYRGDEGLYQHELTHVKQWWCITIVSALLLGAMYMPAAGVSIGVYGMLYQWVPRFRLWAEAQAFKRQLKYYDDDRSNKFAGFIARNYNLEVTHEQAQDLLKA